MKTIYRSTLDLSYMPERWRKVKVIFIPKPGKSDYTSPKSFRPISLTSFFLKGLERLIDRYLKESFVDKPFTGQHAFLEGKKTEYALHELVSRLESTLENRESALCTFMDIEGAFDNVSFEAIGKALRERGIPSFIRRWIQNYLSDKTICYESHGQVTRVLATRGAPQGGVLSPTFWILVMDSLLKSLASATFLVVV